MWKPIQSGEVALSTIKDAATIFVILAVVNYVVALIKYPPAAQIQFIDSLVTIVLAMMLLKWRSRTAAIILLVQSIGGFMLMSYLWLTVEPNEFSYNPGPRLLLAMILSYASIRAVQATFLMHGRFARD